MPPLSIPEKTQKLLCPLDVANAKVGLEFTQRLKDTFPVRILVGFAATHEQWEREGGIFAVLVQRQGRDP